jgi:hypothetical protein
MASQLRQVLDRFADQSTPISIKQMARQMDLDPGVLGGMIDYWVRKGKLREVSTTGDNCTTCGVKGACPFVVAMPRSYELVRPDEDEITPPCTCGGSCSH